MAEANSMRVAYIMSRFPKLTETFVLNEIRAVEAAGVAVEVYPLLRERQVVSHPEAAAWVARARFLPFVSPAIVVANLYFLLRHPRRYLATLWEVLRGTFGSANFFLGALGILPKSVRFAYEMQRRGVTHVHAHFATHPAVAALVIHRLTGIPFSFTAHGSDLHVERRMLPQKVRAAAFVVAISQYNRDVINAEAGMHHSAKVHVIHCGVDATEFRPVSRAHDEQHAVRLVCVASFEEVKGHAVLLAACRLLNERGVAFACDLIGEGPLRAEIEKAIPRLELQEVVHVRGPQPRPRVIEWLRHSDIAVLASRPTRSGKREGIPVVLMEAMAAGLPVVATAISGIPELVDHERSGLLVPPDDAPALAAALERLARDPALRLRMAAAARRKVVAEFDLHQSARMLISHMRAAQAGAQPAAQTTATGAGLPAAWFAGAVVRDAEHAP